MKIFIDIGHPAHVHYFKNFIKIMESKGHQFLITARDKDCTIELLKFNKIKFINRGSGAKSLFGKILYTIKADLIILWHSIFFKPDIYLSHFSIYTAHIAAILRKKCILTGDTDSNTSHKYYIPLISSFLCPKTFKYYYGNKQIFFDSFMELMYLHPNYFSPNKSSVEDIFPNNNKKNVLIRFVSWQAHHDTGLKGIPLKIKNELIDKLKPYCNIFICSEKSLNQDFEKYKLNINPNHMHDFLYSIDFILSESATMASETAILGNSAIYFDAKGRCYTDEQEAKYNLVSNFRDSDGLVEKALELAKKSNIRRDNSENYKKMLSDKIDITAFLVWFVENHPKSQKEMIDNPEYQKRFVK